MPNSDFLNTNGVGTAAFPVVNSHLWVKHKRVFLCLLYTFAINLLLYCLLLNAAFGKSLFQLIISHLVSLFYQNGWGKGSRGAAYLDSNFPDDSKLPLQDENLFASR